MDSFSYYRTDTLRSRAHSDLMLFGTGLILLFCCVVFIIIDNIFMRFRGKQTNFSIKQLYVLKRVAESYFFPRLMLRWTHHEDVLLPSPDAQFTAQTSNTYPVNSITYRYIPDKVYDKSTFCNNMVEILEHLFFHCLHVSTFWCDFRLNPQKHFGKNSDFTQRK